MITLTPIGFAYNERTERTDNFWGKVVTTIVLNNTVPEDSLLGIESFSHLEIIYYFHQVDESKIIYGARHPRNDKTLPKVGIFAQRGKNRPNRLGLTTVKLLERSGKQLKVVGLDCINETPILDIKPVMKQFLPNGEIIEPQWTEKIMKNYW